MCPCHCGRRRASPPPSSRTGRWRWRPSWRSRRGQLTPSVGQSTV
ncbi:hypothetical protein AB0O47_35295 [Streptomyces noursei]